MASADARPVPIKNTAFRAVFPILDADGDLVTGAASLDSEVSLDQGTFTDCANEATEIATASGLYYLDLTAAEMNADAVGVIVKTGTAGAKTTVLVFYPEEAGDINVDVTAFGGTAGTFASGRPEVNASHAAGTAWGSGAITAASIAADAITAAKIADGAIDAATFAAGAINAAAIAADAITDAKVASDVTIASVTGAVGSVTGAVGSVTGNVGGNVAGSVGSMATGGIAASSFAAGAIDAAAIAADAIGSSELAASAVTEIQSGLATSSALSTLQSDVTTLLGRITSTLFTGITSLAEWLGLIAGKQTGNATARTELRATGSGSGTFDETTDSQESVRDRGDAAWTTATGFSTLDAAGVRTAVGLASANLDTQLAAIAAYLDTEIAAILAAVDTEVGAVKTVTDQLVAAQAEPAAAPAANATPLAKIAWLAALARNKVTQTATTQTLLADDGSTPVATATVSDDATTFTRGEWT